MRAPLRAVTNEAHAAGPHAAKQAEADEDTRTMTEWRRRWRTFMSEAVLYFDDIPRDIVQSYRPYLQTLGSAIQPFYDSNVTHVVSDRQTGDVVAKARDKGTRVYTSDKLARFMGSLTGYIPPRIADAAQGAKLDQLLENERRQNTVNAAYARKESNFHTFRGPYILVFDPEHVNRPLSIKEWRVAEPGEGAWPQLRRTPPGMCPFAPRPVAKAIKRREQAEAAEQEDSRQKRRAIAGPSAPGLAGLGLTESVPPSNKPRPVNPLMPDAPRTAEPEPAAEAGAEPTAEPAAAPAAEPTAAGFAGVTGVEGGADAAGITGSAQATGVARTGDTASAVTDANVEDLAGASAPGLGLGLSGSKDVVRGRAPPPQTALQPIPIEMRGGGGGVGGVGVGVGVGDNGDAEKENQVPWAAVRAGPTPSMQPFAQAQHAQATQATQASARLREFGEIVASGVQRYSQTSTKSFAANVGPSREVANLKRKVLPPATAPSRPRAEPTRRDRPAKKPGFCENCLERYEDLGEHLRGQSHVMFATNEKKFKPLAEALRRFEQNRGRRRLYS